VKESLGNRPWRFRASDCVCIGPGASCDLYCSFSWAWLGLRPRRKPRMAVGDFNSVRGLIDEPTSPRQVEREKPDSRGWRWWGTSGSKTSGFDEEDAWRNPDPEPLFPTTRNFEAPSSNELLDCSSDSNWFVILESRDPGLRKGQMKLSPGVKYKRAKFMIETKWHTYRRDCRHRCHATRWWALAFPWRFTKHSSFWDSDGRTWAWTGGPRRFLVGVIWHRGLAIWIVQWQQFPSAWMIRTRWTRPAQKIR
jgi:hypothetical protein